VNAVVIWQKQNLQRTETHDAIHAKIFSSNLSGSIRSDFCCLRSNSRVKHQRRLLPLYTQALSSTDAGVVAVPSRFKWSIETSWRGIDAQGKDLPDTRVMMRLYDPDHNFTAITAQMDLDTAENLQRQLADIIAKKRQNPDYQHRPQLYDPSMIPTGRITGVDDNAQATIEFESGKAK
jgi:hypothetical protein